MAYSGYYREPDIHGDTLIFIADDDLWFVPAEGGIPRRLTSNLGIPTSCCLSPDGKEIAFTGREEGSPEVYVMPSVGGEAKRLTFIGGPSGVLGWSPDGEYILFATATFEPFRAYSVIHRIHRTGSYHEKTNYSWASSISFGPSNGVVLGRFGRDPAQWKRYRGGRKGEIWIDRVGSGKFKNLLSLDSNMTHPMWIGNRIYFMGDHEGYGNIYSCNLSGKNIKRHTDHQKYYVRNPRTDGSSIVYHAGGDIYRLDVKTDRLNKIDIDFRSQKRQRMRKFVDAASSLESYNLHPEAHSLAVIARGKPFTFAHWEGAVRQHGIGEGNIRYRVARWLNDGKRIALVSDEGGEECLEIHSIDGRTKSVRLNKMDLGRTILMEVNPDRDEVILTNQRQELIWVDLKQKKMKILDRNKWQRIYGIAWSPDGRWVAYNFGQSYRKSAMKLCKISTGKTSFITEPVLHDAMPSFDPEGKYLYFLSTRIFDPVMDNVGFDYGFPKGVQPMCIPLQKDLISPFVPQPKGPGEDPSDDSDDASDKKKKSAIEKTKIDLSGIKNRVIAFPLPEGKYIDIRGAKNKVYLLEEPVQGTLSENWLSSVPGADASLSYYDFEKQKKESFLSGLSNFRLSRSGKTLVYQAGFKLRVIKSTVKPDSKHDDAKPDRDSGWIDFNRIKISIEPRYEWKQMYRETWRLLRDQYFTEDMAGVDWNHIYNRYLPLVDRVSTRFELSDLLWELGGELGTSHCYEIGGDYRRPPMYSQGLLGSDLEFDEKLKQYRFTHIVKGDSWHPQHNSPLNQPGMNVEPGEYLTAINGQSLDRETPPQKLLVGLGGKEVILTIKNKTGKSRDITVKLLNTETSARLREWVNQTTDYVHKKTGGRVGYIYMEDMGPAGFSQFHRAFLAEVERDGLILDVRHNGGGHVSSRILQKLARKRLGYEVTRYGQILPSPQDAVKGPMVALCNEFSGSDGDIFAHNFKLMKLGLLIGQYTWGGVVGLNPTHSLVDGAVTTQPEFFNWYDDVGWNLENRGAEPDIIVEYPPQDFITQIDPQLDRAIKEIKKQLPSKKELEPKLGRWPSRKHPKWSSKKQA